MRRFPAPHRLVLLPGDGIGPEVMAEAERVLAEVSRLTGAELSTESIPCGGRYFLAHGRDWPEGSEAKCEAADVILLGAVGWPSPSGGGPVLMGDGKMAGHSAVIGNRLRLDLYANVRPVRVFPGLKQKVGGRFAEVFRPGEVDFVVFRENTEGLYAGAGGILAPGGRSEVGTDTRIITRRASERILRRAFEAARARSGAPKDGKRRVTAVVKNNVLYGCKLFAEIFAEVGASYPDVEQEVILVDAMAMYLVTQPSHYDVVVTTNLFGDILTDLASVLQGGMGMAVGCNVGDEHGMFEPIHGSAPPLTGRDKANPMAMILATAEALRWLGGRKDDDRLVRAASAIEEAVAAVVEAGAPLTEDLGGTAGTRAVTDAVLAGLGGLAMTEG